MRGPLAWNDDVATLLRLFTDPDASRALSRARWERVVRIGRASRLLAALRMRLEEAGALDEVPREVRGHLESERRVARYRKQMVLRELHQLAEALAPVAAPVVLLKGAAYIVQGLRVADARLVSDVDLLVPRGQVDDVEARLKAAGWETEPIDAYDERYYREWSHEVPPMRLPGDVLELDLHHAILPPISRVRTDPAPLFAASRPVPDSPFRVLSPEDQVVHACAHLFVDSDLANRLRDIVDLDGLLRELGAQPGFWDRLPARAAALGLGRALWYGLRYASQATATPIAEHAWRDLAPCAPNPLVSGIMDWLVSRAAPPPPLDAPPSLAERAARALGLVRYFWIRMPLPILLRHAAVKGVRRILPSATAAS